MKSGTKTLVRHRRELVNEWASGAYDFVGTDAVHFSGTILPFAEDTEERDKQFAMFRERRARWLRKQFPDEIWRIPLLTSMLMEETGRCYINGANYATLAMCQAVAESVLRRQAGGYTKEYWRLVKKLYNEGLLTLRERKDLIWLSTLRNPTLHTGSYAKYAKALARAMMPVISRGKITDRSLIESDCRRALSIVVRLLHHLCPEPKQHDFKKVDGDTMKFRLRPA
jgi:hypothetical protein